MKDLIAHQKNGRGALYRRPQAYHRKLYEHEVVGHTVDVEVEIAPQIGIVSYGYQQLSCDSGSGDWVGCLGSHVLGIGPQISDG